jgi:hypothetical protein
MFSAPPAHGGAPGGELFDFVQREGYMLLNTERRTRFPRADLLTFL